MEKYTAESLFDGRLTLSQSEKGYRYTVDPLILCSHIDIKPHNRILDIGCGCGIMPLVLGFRNPENRITGIEIQAPLAELAEKNIIENQMKPKIDILNKDISDLTILDAAGLDAAGGFDQIISNPPYKKIDTGRLNPTPQKAIARHEIKLTIQTLFAKAEELLRPMGRITIIFPAERIFDAYRAMTLTSIRPTWVRFIHTSSNKNAKRVIISAVKNTKSSCIVRPPFHLYDTHRHPTKEYQTIFNP